MPTSSGRSRIIQNSETPLRRESDVARKRKCLMCGKNFKSEWSGERVCRPCKTGNQWKTGDQGFEP